MNIMRKALVVLASAAVLTVGVGLTGCTASPEADTASLPGLPESAPLTYATAYLNEAGLITKYTTSEDEEVFNEGYTSKDTATKFLEQSSPQSELIDMNSTIEIEGKPYPVHASISVTPEPIELVDVISYFNKNTAARYKASYEGGIKPPPTALRYIVRSDIYSQVSQAVTAGQIPAVSFLLTGESSTKVNAPVAAAYASQLPASAAYDSVYGNVDTNSSYHYVYNCATYTVTSDTSAVMAALNSTFKNDVVSFGVSGPVASQINVETTIPCDVVNDAPQKDWNENSGYPDQMPDYPAPGNPNPAPVAPGVR